MSTYNVRVEKFSEKIECVKKIQKYGKLGLVDAKETLENKREFTVEATKDGMFNIYLDFLGSGVISYYNASEIKNTDKKMTALELIKALSNGFEINKNGELVKFHSEKYKFDGNVRLILVPDGIKRIGERAFGGVAAAAVVLLSSVTEIGKSAFEGSKIDEITCNGVIRVEDNAFEGSAFRKISFNPVCGRNLASVGNFAFEGCNAEIVFPETLTYVGYYPFKPFKLTQNTKITVHPENPIYRAVDGRLKCTDAVNKKSPQVEKWLYYEEEPSETAPASTSVPTSASAAKPEAATGNYTLGPNGRLMKARDGIVDTEIPAGVTSIDEGVFENSSTLHSVTLPKSCTIINSGAFRGCKSLYSVSFSVMSFIGNEAFCGCEVLDDVKLSMGGSDPYIGNGAFKGCERLESFECTGRLSCVSEEMLKDCRWLSKVKLPEGVTEIKARAFEGCRDLLTLYLPSTLKRIEKDAFADCRSLTNVYFAGTKEQWCGIENVDELFKARDRDYLSKERFEKYEEYEKFSEPVLYIDNKPLGGSLVFPKSVTKINPGAFSGLSAIRGITFKSGHITVGKDAFSGCEKLSKLKFSSEGGDINIEDGAFEFCYALESIDFPPDDQFARVTVGNSAFGNCCELSELKFGKHTSVKLDDFAFDECKELNSVTASGRIELCDDTFNDCRIGTFYYRDTMEHWCENEFTDESNPSAKARRVEIDGRCVNDGIIIPEGAERLKPYTFVSCNFSSIEIWEPNIKIDKNAFYECTFPSVIRVAYNGLFPPKWVKEVFGKVKTVKLKL